MILAQYPLLILLAPLLAGAGMAILGARVDRKIHRIGVLADVLAFGLSLQILYDVVVQGPQTLAVSPFTGRSDGVLQFNVYIDRLAAVMMVHITAISTLIHLFSVRYMQQERGYARFHSLLALTTFALLGMVASANLLMLFVFWQLLSWLLSFLSYNYAHPATVRGAFRTFTMQRFGDIAFLFGIVVAHTLYGTLDIQQLFTRAAEVRAVYSIWPSWGLEINAATAITLLIFIGAMSKSAQFPLHMWLPDSLYAPTPVHALLHAGIINAGGFLLARLAPLYDLSPTTLHAVFAVGLLTALLGSSMMLTQNDIKKTLGYSTIGQMGFMIMECGLGAFALAIFHLIAHGIFKGTIFLNCGNVIHGARQEPRFPPKHEAVAETEFSSLTWLTGFITTLILPLIILLAGHGVLRIPLRDSHGAVIFLFFGWVTSSQAILTVYRLRAVASWKVAATMLCILFLVVVTYLLAADSFTYFLFPAPGEVASHFAAAALPGALFDFLVATAALLMVVSWIMIYANAHGRSIRLPLWFHALHVRVYLLLVNRLYLDAVALRIGRRSKRLADQLNTSKLFPYIASVTAVITAVSVSAFAADVPGPKIAGLVVAAAMLPLFPLHGVYVAAVGRPRGCMTVCFAILLPIAGLYLTIQLLAGMPSALLAGIGTLALFGTAYGTIKALAQSRLVPLLVYASLSFYSVLWWHIAATGTVPAHAAAYLSAVVLITAGLLLAWRRVQARYGDLALDQLGGLAHPMPRFATLFSLLVMAAVGLPPFALFSGYIQMLLQPVEIAWGLSMVLLTWFAASFYFFRAMQKLLFGPHRTDIPYEDLNRTETATLSIVLLILVAVGLLPYGLFESSTPARGYRSAVEMTTSWMK
jgi:NADH-quinone oxidoreductase subunit L